MMSAKNLRDSILQMAVEGKLVEQREEEGTAADLLASIREQRAQLVREKKVKPLKGGESVIWRDDDGHWFERRGKGGAVCIDDEIPFDIPDSWCWARMRTAVLSMNTGPFGSVLHKEDYVHHGVPVINPANIINGTLVSTKEVTSDTAQRLKAYRLSSGDIVIGRRGEMGRAAVVSDRYDGALCGTGCFFIKTTKEVVHEFWNVIFGQIYVKSYLESNSLGTTMKNLNLNILGNMLIPVSPLREQSRIVEKIDEIKPFVDEYGRAHERREQLDRELPIKLRKSILQAAVEGKLTEQSDNDEPASILLAGIREKRAQLVREGKVKPVKGGESTIYRDGAGHWFERRGKSDPVCIDEEIPFDIPDSWCWARLNGLATLTRGSGIKRSEVREEGLPCVRYGELYTTYDTEIRTPHSFVDRDVFNAAKKLGPDDIVLTLTGENDVDIGRAVINRTVRALAFGGDLLAIADTSVNKNYLLIALHSPAVGKQRTQAATGNIIVHLSAKKVGRFLIPIPPLREQMNICEIMEKLFI